MTLLLSWIGKDSRKISSFYIATDSRFSWKPGVKYDYGRKVFALKNSPDILGYCGDVLYPTFVLNQILEMDKDRILFDDDATPIERSKIIYKKLQERFIEYPSDVVMVGSLQILHVSRGKETEFVCNLYSWSKSSGWQSALVDVPDSSDKVIILGKGETEFYEQYLKYYKGFSGKTSRSLFQCLTHTLLKMENHYCGGAPQLVGLYNRFNGKNFGIVYESKRYYLGSEVSANEHIANIEWRNELFERTDGVTIKILNGAQRQPDELRP